MASAARAVAKTTVKSSTKVASSVASGASSLSSGFAKQLKSSGSLTTALSKKTDDVADAAGVAAKKTDDVADAAGAAAKKTDDVADAAGAAKKSSGALGKSAAMCRRNPRLCTATVAGVGVGVGMLANAGDKQECIADCLPPNWEAVVDDGADVEFHTKKGTEKKPRCTSDAVQNGFFALLGLSTPPDDACEAYCEQACERAHPTTALGVAGEGVREVALPFVEDVIGLDLGPLADIIAWATENPLLFVAGLLVVYVLFKAFVMKSVLGGGRRSRGVAVRLDRMDGRPPTAA